MALARNIISAALLLHMMAVTLAATISTIDLTVTYTDGLTIPVSLTQSNPSAQLSLVYGTATFKMEAKDAPGTVLYSGESAPTTLGSTPVNLQISMIEQATINRIALGGSANNLPPILTSITIFPSEVSPNDQFEVSVRGVLLSDAPSNQAQITLDDVLVDYNSGSGHSLSLISGGACAGSQTDACCVGTDCTFRGSYDETVSTGTFDFDVNLTDTSNGLYAFEANQASVELIAIAVAEIDGQLRHYPHIESRTLVQNGNNVTYLTVGQNGYSVGFTASDADLVSTSGDALSFRVTFQNASQIAHDDALTADELAQVCGNYNGQLTATSLSSTLVAGAFSVDLSSLSSTLAAKAMGLVTCRYDVSVTDSYNLYVNGSLYFPVLSSTFTLDNGPSESASFVLETYVVDSNQENVTYTAAYQSVDSELVGVLNNGTDDFNCNVDVTSDVYTFICTAAFSSTTQYTFTVFNNISQPIAQRQQLSFEVSSSTDDASTILQPNTATFETTTFSSVYQLPMPTGWSARVDDVIAFTSTLLASVVVRPFNNNFEYGLAVYELSDTTNEWNLKTVLTTGYESLQDDSGWWSTSTDHVKYISFADRRGHKITVWEYNDADGQFSMNAQYPTRVNALCGDYNTWVEGKDAFLVGCAWYADTHSEQGLVIASMLNPDTNAFEEIGVINNPKPEYRRFGQGVVARGNTVGVQTTAYTTGSSTNWAGLFSLFEVDWSFEQFAATHKTDIVIYPDGAPSEKGFGHKPKFFMDRYLIVGAVWEQTIRVYDRIGDWEWQLVAERSGYRVDVYNEYIVTGGGTTALSILKFDGTTFSEAVPGSVLSSSIPYANFDIWSGYIVATERSDTQYSVSVVNFELDSANRRRSAAAALQTRSSNADLANPFSVRLVYAEGALAASVSDPTVFTTSFDVDNTNTGSDPGDQNSSSTANSMVYGIAGGVGFVALVVVMLFVVVNRRPKRRATITPIEVFVQSP
jgi:hypothetical protein